MILFFECFPYDDLLSFEFAAFLYSKWKNNKVPIQDVSRSNEFSTDFSGSHNIIGEGKGGNGPELPLFNFTSVATATNNFSDENKLGQGGFGPVYKVDFPTLKPNNCISDINTKKLMLNLHY